MFRSVFNVSGIESKIEMVVLNGDRENRYPGNLNYSFAYVEGESMLMVQSFLIHARGVIELQCHDVFNSALIDSLCLCCCVVFPVLFRCPNHVTVAEESGGVLRLGLHICVTRAFLRAASHRS
jgi:hypothetical protein